eukprot:284817333_1
MTPDLAAESENERRATGGLVRTDDVTKAYKNAIEMWHLPFAVMGANYQCFRLHENTTRISCVNCRVCNMECYLNGIPQVARQFLSCLANDLPSLTVTLSGEETPVGSVSVILLSTLSTSTSPKACTILRFARDGTGNVQLLERTFRLEQLFSRFLWCVGRWMPRRRGVVSIFASIVLPYSRSQLPTLRRANPNLTPRKLFRPAGSVPKRVKRSPSEPTIIPAGMLLEECKASYGCGNSIGTYRLEGNLRRLKARRLMLRALLEFVQLQPDVSAETHLQRLRWQKQFGCSSDLSPLERQSTVGTSRKFKSFSFLIFPSGLTNNLLSYLVAPPSRFRLLLLCHPLFICFRFPEGNGRTFARRSRAISSTFRHRVGGNVSTARINCTNLGPAGSECAARHDMGRRRDSLYPSRGRSGGGGSSHFESFFSIHFLQRMRGLHCSSGMYMLQSCFNHSCQPNCVVSSTDSACITVTTTRPVGARRKCQTNIFLIMCHWWPVFTFSSPTSRLSPTKNSHCHTSQPTCQLRNAESCLLQVSYSGVNVPHVWRKNEKLKWIAYASSSLLKQQQQQQILIDVSRQRVQHVAKFRSATPLCKLPLQPR